MMIVIAISLVSCAKRDNPLLNEYDTPFEVPPFDRIKVEHYLPAFEEGIKQHKVQIAAITNESQAPTFANTVEALERSGALLSRVSDVFFGLNSANTSDEMQEVAKTVAPMLSKHADGILLDAKLFERVKAVYEKREEANLTPEQRTLLDEYYKDFVRGGANLDAAQKGALTKINEELSVLTLQFGENVLKEDNRFELVVDNQEDLAGLPENVIAGAAEAANEREHAGKWVFTLHRPSMIPLLQYSQKRDLREKIFKAYIERGNHNDECDNKQTLSRIVELRQERAKLLGYKTHATFVLEECMAKEPGAVYALLDQLWTPALAMAKKEAGDLQAMINQEGNDFRLEPWDWWYYAEKVKKAKYDLDEEMLRPYFKLENVRKGAFDLATKLYGITFDERSDIPKYHEDVTAFEVKEADGSHVGVLYVDYFPRASKRGGAWMGAYRDQSRIEEKRVAPVICNVGNFSKPTADKPSLLSVDEVTTLFHEFGHALHGLLSNCTYEKLSGTEVATEFVELPSQIMENGAMEPSVLNEYARHYETGEPIPDDLIDKMTKSKHFNQGFATTEYLAASYLDMNWHQLAEPKGVDPIQFENDAMKRIGMIPEIVVRYRSPYFRHVFSGGYAAGYYSYVWAEVLDADAFQAFKETGDLFHAATAKSFRENILAAGGTEDPMKLYMRFRGKKPDIEPLLERRGLK